MGPSWDDLGAEMGGIGYWVKIGGAYGKHRGSIGGAHRGGIGRGI